MKFSKKAVAIATFSAMMIGTLSMPCTAAETKSFSSETTNFYELWKNKYIEQDTYVTDETQYYVFYEEEKYSENGISVPVTVSEAHGYGMLIMASMAEYDEQAKMYFDGMYRYFKAHPSDIGSNLMSWQQCDNGKALIDGANEGSMVEGPCDSATDGDMDIAYALLMADSVWGSDGEIDYHAEAVKVINDIMKYDVNHEYWTLTLGDWVSECDSSESYYHATRASDFMVQYLPIFAEVTGDENWMKVYNTTYGIINDMVATYNTGLLPDFIIRDSSGKFIPAPANFLESDYDGYYYYNSCRVPWRISMDYLINKNEDSLTFANTLSNFMFKNTGGDPWNIKAGYKPDGTVVEDYDDLCFIAPVLLAAACGNNKEWHDKLRDTIVNYGDDVYFGDTIKMLCLIVDDSKWIVPNSEEEKNLIGDVNLDKSVTLADAVLLQKYLIGEEQLIKEQAVQADVLKDDNINCFDLSLLKRNIKEF